jgi:DNA-binding NtrC family response regulator
MDELSPAQPTRARTPAGRATILVVDDAEAMRSELCRALAGAGYRPIPARSGIEAAWCLEREWPVDLVVSDVSMAERDSYHFGMPILELQRRLPVLFMAWWPHDETVRRGILHPGAPYLQKPCPPGLLTRTVSNLLRAGMRTSDA